MNLWIVSLYVTLLSGMIVGWCLHATPTNQVRSTGLLMFIAAILVVFDLDLARY